MAQQINVVTLLGRLTADPELTFSKNNKDMGISSFTLAVSRGKDKNGEEKADFIRCKAFGKLASDIIAKYSHKGDLVCLNGRIQTGSYDDKETGKKVYTTEVVVDQFSMCGSKKDGGSDNATTSKSGNKAMDDLLKEGNSQPDDELPFG